MGFMDLIFVCIAFLSAIATVDGIQCYVCQQEQGHCKNEGFEEVKYASEIKDGCNSCGKEYALLWDFIEAVNRTCETRCVPGDLYLDHTDLKMDWEKVCCGEDLCNSATWRVANLHVVFGFAIMGLITVMKMFHA